MLYWRTSTELHLFTDSSCVHLWVLDMFTGKAKIRSKAASEMLIRRCFCTLEKLLISINLETSSQNQADKFILVPQRWYNVTKKEVELARSIYVSMVNEISPDQISAIHCQSRHPGVRRALNFVKRVQPMTSRQPLKQWSVNVMNATRLTQPQVVVHEAT